MICEKIHCIANYKGECTVEKCQGEITTTKNMKNADKEKRKNFYNISREGFDIYFREEAYES